jgi:hypothetical protein
MSYEDRYTQIAMSTITDVFIFSILLENYSKERATSNQTNNIELKFEIYT